MATHSQDIFAKAEEACQRHGHGFNVDSVGPDDMTQNGGHAVTIRQPPKPASMTDKQWWDEIRRLRNAVERIGGVTKVYLIVADR